MNRLIILPIVLVVIVASIFYLESGKVSPEGDAEVVEIPIDSENVPENGNGVPGVSEEKQIQTTSAPSLPEESREERLARKSKLYDRAKEITTPNGFINTPLTSSGQSGPITIAENVGKKVILLDIWTYSCINCQRTIPYINSWYEKYEDDGLVIIGLHTPEFDFEKEYDNVLAAVEKFGIKYPVVLDNDYSTWRAYKNNYWPRKYLIDIDGFIVYDHIGEGAYGETEKKIQELLMERSAVLGENVSLPASLTEEGKVPSSALQSPETYFGSWRNDNFGNGDAGKNYESDFVLPETLSKNKFYLSGKWKIEREYIESLEEGASFSFPYTARDVYMVAESGSLQTITVSRNGNPADDFAGESVSAGGEATVGASELYKLLHESSVQSNVMKVEAGAPGLRVYTLTFGS